MTSWLRTSEDVNLTALVGICPTISGQLQYSSTYLGQWLPSFINEELTGFVYPQTWCLAIVLVLDKPLCLQIVTRMSCFWHCNLRQIDCGCTLKLDDQKERYLLPNSDVQPFSALQAIKRSYTENLTMSMDGVVPILFGWFLKVPSLHVHDFIQKTFL